MVSLDSSEYIILDGFRPGDKPPAYDVRQEMARMLLDMGYEVVIGVCCELDQPPALALASALPDRPDLVQGVVGPYYVGDTPHGAALWQKRRSRQI